MLRRCHAMLPSLINVRQCHKYRYCQRAIAAMMLLMLLRCFAATYAVFISSLRRHAMLLYAKMIL